MVPAGLVLALELVVAGHVAAEVALVCDFRFGAAAVRLAPGGILAELVLLRCVVALCCGHRALLCGSERSPSIVAYRRNKRAGRWLHGGTGHVATRSEQKERLSWTMISN